MYKLFGFTLYASWAWPYAYVLLYLPLALGTFKLVRVYGLSMISDPDVQKYTTRVVAALIFSLPLWDVLAISIKANYLCKAQGGVHVFKTADAEGLEGGNIQILAPYGFKFTEESSGNDFFRYRMQNGKVVQERIDAITARYGTGGDGYRKLDCHFGKSVLKVVDRTNGEVLSELVKFHIYPGLFDTIVLSSLPGEIGGIPWICGNEPPPGMADAPYYLEMVIKALKPSKNEAGVSK